MTNPRKCPECGAEMVLWEGMWLCPSSPYEHEIAALKAESAAIFEILDPDANWKTLRHAVEHAVEERAGLSEALKREAVLREALEYNVRFLEDHRWVLIETGHNGERIYGMDEWSQPVSDTRRCMERTQDILANHSAPRNPVAPGA